MRKFLSLTTLATLAMALLPSWALAAGGGARDLVVVADTRLLHAGFMKYLANLYNEDVMLFALWSVVLVTVAGSVLGVTMDVVMKATGLDLTKRKIVEH
jgi:hypothetical protein